MPPTSVNTQTITQYGVYQSTSSSTPTDIAITQNSTSLSFGGSSSPQKIQAGALLSFQSENSSVLVRFGISFISAEQACSNAEEEVSDWNWEAARSASEAKWEEVLSRVEIDTQKVNATVVELLYSSVCLCFSLLLL